MINLNKYYINIAYKREFNNSLKVIVLRQRGKKYPALVTLGIIKFKSFTFLRASQNKAEVGYPFDRLAVF